MKLQGNQSYTDSSKKRTWVGRGKHLDFCPFQASSTGCFQSPPQCLRPSPLPRPHKWPNMHVTRALAPVKGWLIPGTQDRLLSCNLLALPKDGGGRKEEFLKTFRKCLKFFVFLKCFVYCFECSFLKLLWAFFVAFNIYIFFLSLGLREDLVVRNPPASAGDPGWIPRSGRSSGRENGNPLQYSRSETPMARGAWQAIVVGSHRFRPT